MGALVRSENDLVTLRVHLTRPEGGAPDEPAGEPHAVFKVLRGSGPAEEVGVMSTRSLGLADWIRSARDITESAFAVEPAIAKRIRDAFDALAEPDEPAYWLELPSPRGYLHLVPWERLLSPALGRPLLRLPNFTLRPQAPGPTLRVVLAAGRSGTMPDFPVGDLVEQLAVSWLESIHRTVLLEVFTAEPDVDDVRTRLAGRPTVTVHDPPPALSQQASAAVGAPALQGNAWAAWLGTALAGKAVDVLHVVAHGMMLGEHGALALPRITRSQPEAWRSTMGVVEVCAALNRTGAWSLLLTAPQRNHCPAGLRDLADAVAHERPGVVALHEAAPPGVPDELRPTLRMLYDGARPMGPTPRIIGWSHPAFVDFSATDQPLCTPEGTSSRITAATQEVLAQKDTPAWVAAGARTLEALQAKVILTGGQSPDPQAVAALEAVSKLFEEHVRTFAAGTPTPSPAPGEAAS